MCRWGRLALFLAVCAAMPWMLYAVMNPLDLFQCLFIALDREAAPTVLEECSRRTGIFFSYWPVFVAIGALLIGAIGLRRVFRRGTPTLAPTDLANDAVNTELSVRKFLLTRKESEPTFTPTTNAEEWRRNTERHTRHFSQTLMLYKQHFGSKVQYLHDELGKQGYRADDLDHLVQHATNTLTIEAGIQALGALGRKLAADEKRA